MLAVHAKTKVSSGVVQIFFVDFILALRIYGMYSNNRKILIFLSVLGALAGVSVTFLAQWVQWNTTGESSL